MNLTKCRFCETPLKYTFANLGMSPLSNSYLKQKDLQQMEPFYPLHVYVCENCRLVQLSEFQSPEQIFGDYAYFSSYSETWLSHVKAYTELMTERFGFDSKSQVVEIASNDGYLLQYFKEKENPCFRDRTRKECSVLRQESRGFQLLLNFLEQRWPPN